MNKFNNVLVNGCSFSRGPGSWPYFLQDQLESNLVNLAQAGAGNTYIHHSTVSELAQRPYDLVLIMWSGLDRTDMRVEDIDYFDQTTFTSKYQSTRNDWAEKIVYPINDQDYVEKNWVFGTGITNNDKFLVNTGLFNNVYRHAGYKENISTSLVHMISLQSILKQMAIPYVFMFYQDYVNDLTQDVKYSLLDQSRMLTTHNLNNIAAEYNSYDVDGVHPGPQAHELWAKHVNDFLTNNYE